MKKFNSVIILAILLFGFTTFNCQAQAPHAFKYQAIVHNASGNILANAPVGLRISILKGSTSGTTAYSETHSVLTNNLGLVNLVIGQGTPVSGSFNSIDWGTDNYYVQVDLDATGGNNYTFMGVSQLLSVPYALFAEKSDSSANSLWSKTGSKVYLSGSADNVGIGTSVPSNKLVVKGDAASGVNDAIFAVVNSDGDTVMAVFPEGARIFVKDYGAGSNSNRSGFAVAGFNMQNSETNEFLRVTPDSTRIYIPNTARSSVQGGFAVSGRSSSRNAGVDDYFNVSTQSSAQIISPSKPRIFWYPNKNAFLAGQVLVQSSDSVGTNSFASGFESKAIGEQSQALGYKPVARGNYSSAIGYHASAKGHNSYAFGNYAFAEDSASYAIGSGAKATGLRSFAIGSSGVDSTGTATNPTIASADYSYAFGMGSQASAKGAFAFGTQNTAMGNYSLALGYHTSAGGWYDIAMGENTYAGGGNATAMGYSTRATGGESTAMGSYTFASGINSTAMGAGTTASGYFSLATGLGAIASGYSSISMGFNTVASGAWSTAIGNNTKAQGEFSTAMGDESTAGGFGATAIGPGAIASGYGATALGQQDTASGDQATVMGQLNIASGGTSTALGYQNIASGMISTAMGAANIASGDESTAMGQQTTASGWFATTMGWGTNASGESSVAMGEGSVAKPWASLVIGQYNDTTCSATAGTEWVLTDPLFIIGNGSDDYSRSNAMTVLKNGETYLPAVFNTGVGATNRDLYIDNTGKLGFVSSSLRYKKNISDMENVDWLYKLRPVNYTYKNDSLNIKQYGLIAEEVENINPLFVSHNSDGSVETVNYSNFISSIIKALQDQKKVIDNQQANINLLFKENERLKSVITNLKDDNAQLNSKIPETDLSKKIQNLEKKISVLEENNQKFENLNLEFENLKSSLNALSKK